MSASRKDRFLLVELIVEELSRGATAGGTRLWLTGSGEGKIQMVVQVSHDRIKGLDRGMGVLDGDVRRGALLVVVWFVAS